MNNEWAWFWQFILGAFLAYYCISPRLRRVVRDLFVYFTPPPRRVIQPRPQCQAVQPPVVVDDAVRTTIREMLRTPAATADYSHKSHIVASADDLEKWLRDNPHLKVSEIKEK